MRPCCAAVCALVLIIKLVLGVAQLASSAVLLPWAVLVPKSWRWLAGLHVKAQKFNHCTSMFHVGVPLEDAWLVLDEVRNSPCLPANSLLAMRVPFIARRSRQQLIGLGRMHKDHLIHPRV